LLLHEQDEFQIFMKDFFALSGIDLHLYKRPQMERRLTALRNRHGYDNFQSYLSAMRNQPGLYDELLDRMTINVSEFFRNPERWEILSDYLQQSYKGAPLTIWSAACSTGEEPYTIAMMLEQLRISYQITATDIDQKVLNSAKVGTYQQHQTRAVANLYMDKYFRREGDAWRVEDGLKKHIKFEIHNLLGDSYPTGLDLIVCRNVLIYFTDEAKQKVAAGFAQALKPGGLLFVGSTEQFLHSEAFGLYSVAPFLYAKKG
jgi:chemotaxis protein methyltransferase CheR